ncbi:uncharacterized protein [Lepeophtheirus salmonis]|uniref:uncharacterized protein isoform X1 n=2 Tax=Lepeophtheirus salmonis TaxID=72036 RepID=UPI003AF3896F
MRTLLDSYFVCFVNFIQIGLKSSSSIINSEIFINTGVDTNVKKASHAILNELKPIFGVQKDCELEIINIDNVQSNIDPEDRVFKMDLLLLSSSTNGSCGLHIKNCLDVQIHVIDDKCKKFVEDCYFLEETKRITCITDNVELGTPKPYHEIPDPSSNEIIQKVAQEATEFLHGFFNVSKHCPLFVRDIISAREQMNEGISYELELQVEVESDLTDCPYKFKNCNGVKVFQPYPHLCPNKKFCLLPQNLEKTTCISIIDSILFTTPLSDTKNEI